MVLNTCYKGKRSYIQSSDVYTEATNVIKRNYGEDCWILHISFRGFIHNQVTLLTEQKDNNGTIKVKIKDKVLTLFMVESNKKVNCYKNDDDYKIKKICWCVAQVVPPIIFSLCGHPGHHLRSQDCQIAGLLDCQDCQIAHIKYRFSVP